jgi:signal transduction histidine kinase
MPELKSLLGVVSASMDEDGLLLEANAGFLRLVETSDSKAEHTLVAQFFIQPDFLTLLGLVNVANAPDTPVYEGLLTVGDFVGKTRTLRGRVWHAPGILRLLAEFDIAELEHLNDTVLNLNRSYAHAQLELAQTNFKLKQSASELLQANADLKTSNASLAQSQAQLLQADKLASIGLLAAGVAHEINTPMGYVNSNLGMLKTYVGHFLEIIAAYEAAHAAAGSASSPHWSSVVALKESVDWPYLKGDVLPLLDQSQDGLDRVKHIVRALNDFARTDAQDVWRIEDVHRGIESTLSLFWSQIKHRCELRKEYGDLPAIVCVLPKLNQVFLNLLQNAAQAIKGQGCITLRTGVQDAGVWIEVADDGPGIAAEDLGRVFDPFFTTKPLGQGTGLGLSIAYGIVQQHHGTIEVSSTPGHGASFRVCLPFVQPKVP